MPLPNARAQSTVTIDSLLANFDEYQAPGATGSASPVRYQTDPLAWMVERMGVPRHTIEWSLNEGYGNHEWDGTVDPFVSVLRGLVEHRDVGVESGTGTGKTFLGALTVLWFLSCFEDSIVITSAPKEGQLTLHIWKEIGRHWPHFQRLHPDATLDKLRIRMRPGSDVWAAHGFAAAVGAGEESATRAQGFHAASMLIVLEETPGIPLPIMTAFENTATAPHNLRLAFGNPDSQTDALHEFCTKESTLAIRISALDHPNVVCKNAHLIPGAVSVKTVDKRRVDYGADSRMYLSRVRGICPNDATDALIRWAWCHEATKKDAATVQMLKNRSGPAIGTDVANSKKGDMAAIAMGVGDVLLEVQEFPCPDSNLLGNKVAILMKAGGVDPKRVGVDPIGVGAGTINELTRQGYSVRALNASEKPVKWKGAEEFENLRAQMWWQLRVDLQNGNVVLPDDPLLFQDLCEPRWNTPRGKILLESKDAIRGRLGRSPNKGDAVAFWNWVRVHRGTSNRLHADLVTF